MQAPVSQTVRKWIHALTRKFVTEIFVSSLATLVVMALFPNLTKPIYLFSQDGAQITSSHKALAEQDTNTSLDDFLERVALSHISGPKASQEVESQEAIAAVSEPTTDMEAPLSPLPSARPRHERTSSKVHAAANAAKNVPAPQVAMADPPAGQVSAVIEPAAAAAPVKAEVSLVAPLQYGMHLVSDLGTIISVSQTRVVQSVTTVGDTLTSLAKKL
jgi:cytoskeletal protein RodZ